MTYEDFKAEIESIDCVKKLLGAGGQCPFQVEALLKPCFSHEAPCMYFRARGEAWQFEIYPTTDWLENREQALFYVEQEWGEPSSAGYMKLEEALPIIKRQLEEVIE